jgi:hypothetical protein
MIFTLLHRNEGLRALEPDCEIGLGEIRLLARLDQELTESFMRFAPHGVWSAGTSIKPVVG